MPSEPRPTITLTNGYVARIIGPHHPYLWVGPAGDAPGEVFTSERNARLTNWLCKALSVAMPGSQVRSPRRDKPRLRRRA